MINHIESGFCPRLDTATLDQLREEKLEFPRRLEQLTQEKVKGNYMSYMPSATASNTVSAWHIDKEPEAFEMVEEDFPALATAKNTRIEPTKADTSNKLSLCSDEANREKGNPPSSFDLPLRPAVIRDETMDVDTKPKARAQLELPLRLLSDSKRNVKDGQQNQQIPTQVSTLPAFKSGITTVVAGMDADDPYNPSFNAASCYCSITERFNCPKRLCG